MFSPCDTKTVKNLYDFPIVQPGSHAHFERRKSIYVNLRYHVFLHLSRLGAINGLLYSCLLYTSV